MGPRLRGDDGCCVEAQRELLKRGVICGEVDADCASLYPATRYANQGESGATAWLGKRWISRELNPSYDPLLARRPRGSGNHTPCPLDVARPAINDQCCGLWVPAACPREGGDHGDDGCCVNFFFLDQRSRPNIPRPDAKSRKVAGCGTATGSNSAKNSALISNEG
jgi:hypothetical protein